MILHGYFISDFRSLTHFVATYFVSKTLITVIIWGIFISITGIFGGVERFFGVSATGSFPGVVDISFLLFVFSYLHSHAIHRYIVHCGAPRVNVLQLGFYFGCSWFPLFRIIVLLLLRPRAGAGLVVRLRGRGRFTVSPLAFLLRLLRRQQGLLDLDCQMVRIYSRFPGWGPLTDPAHHALEGLRVVFISADGTFPQEILLGLRSGSFTAFGGFLFVVHVGRFFWELFFFTK